MKKLWIPLAMFIFIFGTATVCFSDDTDPPHNGSNGTDPPIIDQILADPVMGLAPLYVEFEAIAYDPDGGDIVLYEWDFDIDGTYDFSDFDRWASFTFYDVGDWDVGVRVTDEDGSTGVGYSTISVVGIVPEPTTLLLLVAGLIGLAGLGRKIKMR